MCGLAGILTLDARDPAPDTAARMGATLARRGPDGSATHVEPGFSVAHARLAIVDVTGGGQPMTDDRGCVLVANAEIYNHRELRRELERRGQVFHTRCDVEVILRGYQVWGDDVVRHLDGMFAFALWDKAGERLLLARDRLGQKPLYYLEADGRFLFASEPKAILTALPARPGLDPDALARYLLLDFVPTPRAIHRGMWKLPAGHLLVVSRRSAARAPRAYWTLPRSNPWAPPLRVVEHELVTRFDRALARRLMSDVPIGLLLSGGFDSALVGASLASTGLVPPSFSVSVDDPDHDEGKQARATARALGLLHHERSFGVEDFRSAVPAALSYLDEPLADPSLLAVHALSELAAEHVKVVLGGDGADELFGGYDVVLAAQLDRYTRALAPGRDRVARALARWLPAREGHFSLDFRLNQYVRALRFPPALRPLAYTLDLDLAELRGLAPFTRGIVEPLSELAAAAAPESDELAAGLRAYVRMFLESDILVKLDRAGMAHGLEIRSPFFDHELVEYVAALPASMKVRGLSRKWLLKRALGHRVPRAVARRRKRGFSLPIVKWLNGALAGWFDEVLLDPMPWSDGLIRRDEVARLLAQHRAGRRNLRKPLYNLAVFALWRSAWG